MKDSIAGLANVKAILRKSVLLPIQFPSLFTGGRKPWNQILLYGPPGTGKSRIAGAIAKEANVRFYCVSSADLLSSWVGESEKMVKELFDYTRSKGDKSIVFIDEIDSICRKRSDREGEHTRSMKNQLLVELDYNISIQNTSCFVLCATNCPWDIDFAFMRRFQCRIYVPLPDWESRLQILKTKSAGVGIEMSEDDWKLVASRTDGYSGSDLTNVVSFAIQEPLGELDNVNSWIVNQDSKWVPCLSTTRGCLKVPMTHIPPEKISVRNVNLKDFTKAIAVIPKTVSDADLDKYKKFMCLNG